jgi:hypothetical protein
MSATSLLDTIQDGRAISHSTFEDLLAKDFDLVDDYDSWTVGSKLATRSMLR